MMSLDETVAKAPYRLTKLSRWIDNDRLIGIFEACLRTLRMSVITTAAAEKLFGCRLNPRSTEPAVVPVQ